MPKPQQRFTVGGGQPLLPDLGWPGHLGVAPGKLGLAHQDAARGNLRQPLRIRLGQDGLDEHVGPRVELLGPQRDDHVQPGQEFIGGPRVDHPPGHLDADRRAVRLRVGSQEGIAAGLAVDRFHRRRHAERAGYKDAQQSRSRPADALKVDRAEPVARPIQGQFGL